MKNNCDKGLTFVDLFAGAGGLSEGFMRAGFIPIAHIEMDKDSCFTLKTRTAFHYLKNKKGISCYQDYLKGKISREELYLKVPDQLINTVINDEINGKNINEIFKKIDLNLKLTGRKKIDLLIGGPPCQVYSTVGRARIGPDRIKNDSRYYLYKYYGQFLKKFKPKIFIFENVPGILSVNEGKLFEQIKNYFEDCGYKMKWEILDASKFGVLQKRKRFIAIGYLRNKKFEFPEFEEISYDAKVYDIFSDLPFLNAGESIMNAEYISDPSEYLSQTGIRNGSDFVTLHMTRPHNKKDLKIYKQAIQTWNKKGIRIKYTDIPEKERTHKNVNCFLDRFKVINGGGNYCHTIVAHISKDGHYYIHPDIKQVRSISVREAARIQSFPDEYFFEGSRTAAFKQVGNAVPPLMAERIAISLKSLF